MALSSPNRAAQQPVFYPEKPRPWKGRYNRIPGEASVFHMRYASFLNRFWPQAQLSRDGDTLVYYFADCQAIRDMADHVCRFQEIRSGVQGGSFLINEWGQVLVPDPFRYKQRYYVGRLQGGWSLMDPLEPSRLVSLDGANMACGDPWDLPYVGIPYRLSKQNRLYFVQPHPHGDELLYPPKQDLKLIARIREIRKWGPVSFIVNPFGVVLVKRPERSFEEESWRPVYVGRIEYSTWFHREED